MKRITIAALALALLPGLALAQNITRSLQGSQDPRGPVGVDTSNSAYFPNHINAFGNTTGTPSLASGGNGCSSSSITAGSVDTAGSVAVVGAGSTAATSCTITFGSPYNSAPFCMASFNTQPTGAQSNSQFTVATTTTSFNVTQIPSGATVAWICIGNK